MLVSICEQFNSKENKGSVLYFGVVIHFLNMVDNRSIPNRMEIEWYLELQKTATEYKNACFARFKKSSGRFISPGPHEYKGE